MKNADKYNENNELRSYNGSKGHGIKFEDYVINKYNLVRPKEENGRWDAYIKNGTPVSIKTTQKGGEICLADIFRQASIEEEAFAFVIGYWVGNVENITEIYLVRIEGDLWRSMFTAKPISYFRFMLNHIDRNGFKEETWERMMQVGDEMWEDNTLNIIKPRYRRGSFNRSGKFTGTRIQCSIRCKDFEKHFLKDPNKFIKSELT